MTILLCILGVVFLVLLTLAAWANSTRSKTKIPQATTTSTSGATTGTSTKTRTFSWDGIRNAWFPIVALAAALICGYIVNPDFTSKVVENRKFWAFIVLGATAYLFLSVHAPFKENKLRKLILFAFFLWGVVLLLDVSGVNISKSVGNTFSSKSPPTTLEISRPGVPPPMTVKVNPATWSQVRLPIVPPGVNYTIERPGRLEYDFGNGRIVVSEDGENVSLGRIPRNFKIRGTAGEVLFTFNKQ